MKRLITGFGLTLALLFTLGALDSANALHIRGHVPLPPGPDGNTPVWRAQLRIRVCDVDNAGTDNKVLASLNNANSTVMDTPVNDFERASEITYDLLLNGVTRLADISQLKISKGGSNAICLNQLTLLVNERQIYTRSYAQLWLDNTCSGCDYTLIPGYTLRAHSSWLGWTTLPRPRLLYSAEIYRRLATAAGTGMYDFNVQSINSLRWDSDMWLSEVDGLTITVRMFVYHKCIDPTFGDAWCDDVSIPYEAELRFSCTPGGTIVATKVGDGTFLVDGHGFFTIPAGGAFETVRNFVGSRLPLAFLNIKVPNCAPIVVSPVGDSVQVQF